MEQKVIWVLLVDVIMTKDNSIPVELPSSVAEPNPTCELEGRIKEAEYWRDQLFAPEYSSMKIITMFDFATRIAELKASKP